MSLTDVQISDFSGGAAGIFAETLIANRFSFTDNTHNSRPAVIASGSGTSVIINSTFSGNRGTNSSERGTLINSSGNLEVINSTFDDNITNGSSEILASAELVLIGNILADDFNYDANTFSDLGGNLFASTIGADLNNKSVDGLGSGDFGFIEPVENQNSGPVVIPISKSSLAVNYTTPRVVTDALARSSTSDTAKEYLNSLADGSATDARGERRKSSSADSGSFETLKSSSGFTAPSPFAGAVVTEVELLDQQIVVRGTNLQQIESLELAGVSLIGEIVGGEYLVSTESLEPNEYVVSIQTSGGLVQTEFTITVAENPVVNTSGYWTKRNGDNVKVYAKNIVGVGKVQFFVNGEEIAWIRAVDNTDPKLRVITEGPMTGAVYLVRDIDLEPGKNVFEIYVDGQRVERRIASLR